MSEIGVEKLQEPPLRALLARGLRHGGFRYLCKGEPSDFTRISVILSQNILISVIVGINFFFVFHLGLVFWQTGLLTMLTLLVLAMLISRAAISSTFFYLLYVVTWLVLVCILLYRDGLSTALLTFGLPFLLTPFVRWLPGALRFTQHIPFFIPLALILVLLPLLTEDPWRLATAAESRIAVVALIAAAPLIAVLVMRVLRLDLGSILESAVDEAVKKALDLPATVRAINKTRDTSREKALDFESTSDTLIDLYTADEVGDQVGEIVVSMSRRYRWVALRHFVRLLSAVAISIFTLIYVLAWTAVPPSLAADWAASAVPFLQVGAFGGEVNLPLGPYVQVSLLLSTVAWVGFLGFTITEDQYSDALWNAVAVRPAYELFTLGIPYLLLRKRDEAEV